MVTRFEGPIKTQHFQTYVSQFVPMPTAEIKDALGRKQKSWEENEEMDLKTRALVSSIEGAQKDLPYIQNYSQELFKAFDELQTKNPDLGSYEFKRGLKELQSKLLADPKIKTWSYNKKMEDEMLKSVAKLKEDNKYDPALHQYETRGVDEKGQVVKYNYNIEALYGDKDYHDVLKTYTEGLTADQYSKAGFTPDEMGNIITGKTSLKELSPAKVQSLAKMVLPSISQTNVGAQKLKLYERKFGDKNKAVAMMLNDIASLGMTKTFRESSNEQDFKYAPNYIHSQRQKEKEAVEIPNFQVTSGQPMVMSADGTETPFARFNSDNPNDMAALNAEAQRLFPNDPKGREAFVKAITNDSGIIAPKTIMFGSEVMNKVLPNAFGFDLGKKGNDLTPLLQLTVKDNENKIVNTKDLLSSLGKGYTVGVSGISTNPIHPGSLVLNIYKPSESGQSREIKTVYVNPPESVIQKLNANGKYDVYQNVWSKNLGNSVYASTFVRADGVNNQRDILTVDYSTPSYNKRNGFGGGIERNNLINTSTFAIDNSKVMKLDSNKKQEFANFIANMNTRNLSFPQMKSKIQEYTSKGYLQTIANKNIDSDSYAINLLSSNLIVPAKNSNISGNTYSESESE